MTERDLAREFMRRRLGDDWEHRLRMANAIVGPDTFNALFTHRVRVRTLGEIDRELQRWLKDAYRGAS